MNVRSALPVMGVAFSCWLAAAAPVPAQTAPGPTPSATPAASPSPAATKKPKRFNLSLDSYTSGIDQQFVGPGIVPPQAPIFSASGLNAPGTPYDYFTHDPLVTGNAIHQALTIRPSYAASRNVDLSITAAYGSVGGNGNVASYWGDAMQPYLNPHLGYRTISVPPAFPTHNGATDAVSNSRGSILSGAVSFKDSGGAPIGAVRGGWIDLHQSLPFVFAQTPQTNADTTLVPRIRGSAQSEPPTYPALAPTQGTLPILGIDAWAKIGNATVEGTNAYIASNPNAPARITSGSAVLDNGNGIVYKTGAVHLNAAGPDPKRVLFGAGATLAPTAYGPVPYSITYAQRETIVGAGATFPFVLGTDLDLRYAWSCYGANGVAQPTASCTTGSYYFARLHHGFPGVDLALDLVRFEPRFAPAVLTYGLPIENVWSIPFAYPMGSLNGYYQLVDTNDVSPNRQGLRLSADFIYAKVETKVTFASYQQVATSALFNTLSSGFVEPFFATQTGPSSFGREQSIALSFAWRPKYFGDVTLDLYDAIATRLAPAGFPGDAITMNYPAGVFAISRELSPRFLGAVGVGRFASDGAYEQSGAKNADLVENMIFAGLQFRTKTNTAYGLQWRWISVNGSPTVPGGPSPAFHGPQVLFSQRFKT